MSDQASKRARRRNKQLAFAKSQGGWNRAHALRRGCPTPQKRRFGSRESAEANAKAKVAYRCPCGDWHLKTAKGAGK